MQLVDLAEMGSKEDLFSNYTIIEGVFTPESTLSTRVLTVDEAKRELEIFSSKGIKFGYGENELQCFELTTKLTYQYKGLINKLFRIFGKDPTPYHPMEWYLKQIKK